MERSKVIEKIKKCLALAASDNPNESATALRQAHSLMEKYGITVRDTQISDVTVLQVMADHSSKIPTWAAKLVSSCASAFQCIVLFQPAKGTGLVKGTYPVGAYRFYGTADNVDLATYAYAQISRAHQSARKHFEASLPGYLSTKGKRLELKSFSEGWAQAVQNSIADFAKSFRESAHCLLLKDAASSTSPITQYRATRPARLTANGFQQGQSEGSKVSIRTGLNAAVRAPQLSHSA